MFSTLSNHNDHYSISHNYSFENYALCMIFNLKKDDISTPEWELNSLWVKYNGNKTC